LAVVYGSETVHADLPVDLDGSRTWLVTTRLHNDEGLHRDFVKRSMRLCASALRRLKISLRVVAYSSERALRQLRTLGGKWFDHQL
jgi:hypothetical protein